MMVTFWAKRVLFLTDEVTDDLIIDVQLVKAAKRTMERSRVIGFLMFIKIM